MTSLTQTDFTRFRDQRKRDGVQIRPYTAADIPFITGRVMVEVPKLPHYVGVKVERKRIEQVMTDGLNNPSQFMARMLWNHEKIVGGVCGYCVTQMLSFDKMTGDIFLYIDPEYRSLTNVLKLMDAYKNWAIAQGATIIMATQTGGLKGDKLGRLLERFGGYKQIGGIYYYQIPGTFTSVSNAS